MTKPAVPEEIQGLTTTDKMRIHELLAEFQTFGCADKTETAVAARVYADLIDVVKLQNLEKNYDGELNRFYFRGSKFNSDKTEIYLPLLSCKELDLKEIDKIRNCLCGTDDSNSLIAAICDPSSNILYYRLTKGFIDRK